MIKRKLYNFRLKKTGNNYIKSRFYIIVGYFLGQQLYTPTQNKRRCLQKDTAHRVLPFRIRAFSGLQCGPDLDIAAAGKTCALVKLFARLADAETKSSYVGVSNVLCRKRLEAFNYQPVIDFLAVILQEAARAGLGHRQISTSMCITLEAGILNVILSPSKLISSNAFSKTTSG